MELPAGLYVKPVAGSDDVVAFNYPFLVEGKALGSHADIEELEDGDLVIEGWASDFNGVDRQGENFTDGAFAAGIKDFLEHGGSLCYHHQYDKVLGKVLDLEEVEGKGLRIKARIDGAIKNHPELGTIYSQVKRGTLRGLSVGGFFKRVMTPRGVRIGNCDFTEISVTGVPIHSRPNFAVVAGKALQSDDVVPTEADFPTDQLAAALENVTKALDAAEGKSVKGKPFDLEFLSVILKLEQTTNNVVSHNEIMGDDQGDERVDSLAKRVKNYLDGVAREAHEIAADLGPLPSTGY